MEIKIFVVQLCLLIMSSNYQKSDKTPFVIYAHFECIIEKTDGCNSNPDNSSKIKVSKHVPSDFSMCAISSFISI